MSEPQLQLIDRKVKPYRNAKSAIKDGYIPGVLYGKGTAPQTFFTNESDLLKLLSTYGTKRKIKTSLNGNDTSVIIKDYQKDALKNKFIHIDLQALNENEKIKVLTAIHITNREAVEQGNKILQVQNGEVEIQMFPRHMPESVTADAALLLEKDSITLSDLNIANDQNIEILSDMDTVVATLVYAQRQVEEATEDAAKESEEGAATKAESENNGGSAEQPTDNPE